MDIFILRNGEQTGPFSEQTVQTLLTQAAIRPQDMAWRKGLPAWLPLSEVLNPGSQKPSEPPPAVQVSGINAAAPSAVKSPTSKQKALLKYLGVEFSEKAGKEEVAVLISDAIENPKLQARLAKWGEEKLRLHSDIFADEVEHRKSNRGGIYVERCQTEGEGVVKDVTKAHCQVLVESLDKRFPAWESNPKDALWQYFFPAIAEHFPMLVVDSWKSKLKFGSAPKSAGKRTAGPLPAESEPAPSSPLFAALKGIAYGVVALAAIIGVMQMVKTDEPVRVTAEPAKTVSKPTTPPAPEPEKAPAVPAEAPLIAAVPPTSEPPAASEPPAPAPVPTEPATPPPAPAPAMAEAPAPPPVVPVNPVPPGPPSLPRIENPITSPPVPPVSSTTSQPMNTVPPAPPAPAAPKTTLTLTKPVSIQLQFGKVTLPPGTRMRFLSAEPTGLKCNFNNNIVLVPAGSTDYDGPPLPGVATPVAPTAPVLPGNPGVPAAPPKPVNSSDL